MTRAKEIPCPSSTSFPLQDSVPPPSSPLPHEAAAHNVATTFIDHGVLVVNNLPFFCQERDLSNLFNSYGHVRQVVIYRHEHVRASNSASDDYHHSSKVPEEEALVVVPDNIYEYMGIAVFAKVIVESISEANEIIRIMNNHLLMGRRFR